MITLWPQDSYLMKSLIILWPHVFFKSNATTPYVTALSLLPPPPPPPLPPVPLHHQFGTFILGYSFPGDMERNVKTRETWLILPPWPFRFSFYHSLHFFYSALPLLIHSPPHCLFLFLSCHLHCEEHLAVSLCYGCVSKAGGMRRRGAVLRIVKHNSSHTAI